MTANDYPPLVSVAVPIFNQRRAFLEECIASVCRQTYRNLEIVLSDNHSTNDVPEVIREFASKDHRIRIVRPAAHLSMMESYLFAADSCTGEYATVLSSDDFFYHTFVERMVDAISKYQSAGIGYCLFDSIGDQGEVISTGPVGRTSGLVESKHIFPKMIGDRDGTGIGFLTRRPHLATAVKTVRKYNLEILGDLALAVALTARGDCFFYPESLATVRLWKNPDRDNRLQRVVNDFGKLYQMAENEFPEAIARSRIDMRSVRLRKAFSLSMHLPFLISRSSAPIDICTLHNSVLRIADRRSIRCLLQLSQVRLLHPIFELYRLSIIARNIGITNFFKRVLLLLRR